VNVLVDFKKRQISGYQRHNTTEQQQDILVEQRVGGPRDRQSWKMQSDSIKRRKVLRGKNSQ
jgi:hypothetical protein